MASKGKKSMILFDVENLCSVDCRDRLRRVSLSPKRPNQRPALDNNYTAHLSRCQGDLFGYIAKFPTDKTESLYHFRFCG